MGGPRISEDPWFVLEACSIGLMALLAGLKVVLQLFNLVPFSTVMGETKVLAAVYGPKAGTKKNENPEKACIEVIWKPKTGQSGKPEREYEMVLKKTLQSICLLNVHPNTTTSIIIQLLPCAINAACSALVDAGIPLKHLAVAICCCMAESGHILLDPSKLEEQGFVCKKGKSISCLKMGRAAAAELSDFLRNSLKSKAGNDPSKAS
ncbi:hypothetical protein E3N88_14392 [Mikania micrantha]|uniref:Exoribonuclease phosphorolytic domain-containing protein n=1 Tax=Mikania micrantha TaxID=192012 RepID=A0A5N6P1L4_9ASTR|nr:hypothetical protein E3N88_14392 [Mikania micrantha]